MNRALIAVSLLLAPFARSHSRSGGYAAGRAGPEPDRHRHVRRVRRRHTRRDTLGGASATTAWPTTTLLAARSPAMQNGRAIAGDYMSAASLLGISALVFTERGDGLIYSIGFLASWPIILFLMLPSPCATGRYTLADVLSYRLQAASYPWLLGVEFDPLIVLLYLVSQMVGAGKLDGTPVRLQLTSAVVLVGVLAVVYVFFGGHAGHHVDPDHQGRHAAGRLRIHGLHGHAPFRLRPEYPLRARHHRARQARRHHAPRRSGLRSSVSRFAGAWR